MFDLTGKTRARHRRERRHRRRASPRRCTSRARPSRLSGPRREALETLAGELGGARPRAALQPVEARGCGGARPAAEKAMGARRYPRQQCRASPATTLFVRMKDEDWEKVIAVNLTAAFRLSRAAVFAA